MNKEELLTAISALRFAAYDLQLYLDTHPYDQNAIVDYHNLTMEADRLQAKYEEKYGLIAVYNSPVSCPWAWGQGYWPYERKNQIQSREEV